MNADQITDLVDVVGDNYVAIYLAAILHTHTTGQETFEARDIYPWYCELADYNTQFHPRRALMRAHANGEDTLDRYVRLSPRFFKRKLTHINGCGLLERIDDNDTDRTYRIIDPPADPTPLLDALDAESTLSFPPGILDYPPRVEYIEP